MAGSSPEPITASAVDPLDGEFLDLTCLGCLRECSEHLDEVAVVELLQPQDPLPTALDVEQRLAVPEASRRPPARAAGRRCPSCLGQESVAP